MAKSSPRSQVQRAAMRSAQKSSKNYGGGTKSSDVKRQAMKNARRGR